MLTLPNNVRMNVSSASSGKFVMYSVDFHARWTATSWPCTRFLSFVSAAGTLSCTALPIRRQDVHMEDGRDPYSIHELDRSDKSVGQLRDLDLSKAATLRRDQSVRPGMVI